jgi:hypothetical protein
MSQTQQPATIEIYENVMGRFSLTQSNKGKRWPLVAFGPSDGFATRAEAEQRKADIETGKWQDTSKRIPVGFDPIAR